MAHFDQDIDEINHISVYVFYRNQMRGVKSHMYEAANPKEGFMAEKVLKLKKQKKIEANQKKKEGKSQQNKQQTSPNKKGNKKKK